jgi:hypothetical protein
VVFDDFLESTADHFGKAHFIFGSKTLGLAKERIWDLHLCFYHAGILLTRVGCVNFSAKTRFLSIVEGWSFKPLDAVGGPWR